MSKLQTWLVGKRINESWETEKKEGRQEKIGNKMQHNKRKRHELPRRCRFLWHPSGNEVSLFYQSKAPRSTTCANDSVQLFRQETAVRWLH